jgi:3-methyl-2-oxobutanoate hydroxymethyltransferase
MERRFSRKGRGTTLTKLTVYALQQMKRDQKKIAALVANDFQMAQILDRAGVDLISVGDSVGQRLFGQPTHLETTMDQMVLCSLAVARGVKRAVVNCDLPFGPIQRGPSAAVDAAIRLVQEGLAEMVKIDGAAENPETVAAVAKAGIPVWGQMGFTPQTTQAFGGFTNVSDEIRMRLKDELVEQAKRIEGAGASMLDCTNVGNEIIGAIAAAVTIPAIGGHNTGANADGRVGVSYNLVGYAAGTLDQEPPHGRVHVGRIILDAMSSHIASVRDGTAPA